MISTEQGRPSHWTGKSAMLMAGQMRPPFSFWKRQKENAPRPVEEKKRFGGSVCASADLLPPAGGRLAVPCGSQGRKRAALGESFGPGKLGIHPASLFAAAGGWSMKVAAWVNATVSTTARAARSEAERAEREAGQMRSCTPTRSAPSATGRQYRPGRRPKRARRPAQIDACTDTPTPVARRATAPKRA